MERVGSPWCVTHRVSQGAAESLPVTGKQVRDVFFHVSVLWDIVELCVMPLQADVSVLLL